MRAVLICTILLSALPFAHLAVAQQAAAAANSENAICTFEDGKQITARYNPMSVGKENAPAAGKVLIPGGAAMTFFTETDLMLGGIFIHIYLSTIGEPGTFEAMTRGAVSEAWAWTFHPAWYKDVTGRDPRQAHDEALRRMNAAEKRL